MRIESFKVTLWERIIGFILTFMIIAGLFTPVWWASIGFCLMLGCAVWLKLRTDVELAQPVSLWLIPCIWLVFPSILFGVAFVRRDHD